MSIGTKKQRRTTKATPTEAERLTAAIAATRLVYARDRNAKSKPLSAIAFEVARLMPPSYPPRGRPRAGVAAKRKGIMRQSWQTTSA